MAQTIRITEIIENVRAGQSEAFSEIVRRFQDMAVGYSYSLLHDLQLAEDAAQEAFLESYLNLSQLREPEAFPGWFRKIVFKQCDRILRRRSLNTVPLENDVSSRDDERREIHDEVWTAVRSLPENERTPVVLFYLGGYSQQEIGAFLDVPAGTIKKRLFDSRKKLRKLLVSIVADTLSDRRPSRDEKFASSVIEMLRAARSGDVQQVRELLARNSGLLNARDWLGNSPLIVAVNSGHAAIAELLFKAGVEPDIHEAAAIGQTENVARLLDHDVDLLDSFSAEGFTPLALAAHFGHESTVRLLLERGASIDQVSRHPLQVTPLHAALFGRQVSTATLLVEAGADSNLQRGGSGWPRAGFTATHYAAAFGMISVLELLLDAGADLTRRDERGLTPLEVALEADQTAAAALLRKHLDQRNKNE